MDDEWLYRLWGLLLLVLLCVRVWVCLIRMLVRYERDKQTDDEYPGDTG